MPLHSVQAPAAVPPQQRQRRIWCVGLLHPAALCVLMLSLAAGARKGRLLGPSRGRASRQQQVQRLPAASAEQRL